MQLPDISGTPPPISLTPEERGLAEIVSTVNEPVIVTRANLAAPGPTIIAVSAGFCALTRYTAEELIGESPRRLQGPLTDRSVLDRLRTACAKGERFTGEAVNYRKDGSTYIVEWSIDPIRAETSGVVTHFIAVQRDVTELRPYARQWLESEARARAALERASEQMAAISSAILVLEQTKNSFRSVQLGVLRQQLKGVLARPAPLPSDAPSAGES